MNTVKTPVIMLLAAGASRRFGAPKQLAMLDGEPLLRRAARTAMATRLAVTVVLGANAGLVRRALDGLALDICVNCAWDRGMGNSIACGVQRVQSRHPDCSGVLLCLADQPYVDTAALLRMIDSHRHAPQHIIAANHGDTVGPPCLFPRALFDELGNSCGDQGARALLQRHQDLVRTIALPQAAFDIDTPADLQQAVTERR